MRFPLFTFLALCVVGTLETTTLESTGDRTVTKVVKLLQAMMDKSKKDAATDRDNYAKFKCYCDKNEASTKETLAEAEESIAEETNLLADRRAANEKLSQEVAALRKSMDDNAASRGTATTNRRNEKSAFETEESDLITGIDQLERAIQLLSAVGADQTANTAEDHTRFMAASAVAAANAPGLIMTKKSLKSLDVDTKQALRAASVFLTSVQRKSLTSFLEAPFTGVYSSQSTEIVGILKNMNDTYWSNLQNAQLKEATALSEYTTYMDLAWDEMREMRASWNAKKSEIGVNAGEIATATTDLSTAEGTKETTENFLSDLANRCKTKTEEYEKRKMLRANEDAAIAQAISILNSDDSFDTFGSVSATSTGRNVRAFFAQLATSTAGLDNTVRRKVMGELIKESKSLQSKHLAQVATAMTSNPFTQVLKMIDDMILVIEEEGKDDVKEKQWCKWEQGNGTRNEGIKTTEIGGLTTNIRTYKSDRKTAEGNIKSTKANLLSYRTSMDTETATRTATNAAFKEDLKNLQEAEKILAKALAVLEKYYDWLHAHNGAHTYTANAGFDSGGANIERMAGKSVDELKEACSNMPDCAGFNTDGWLKSSIADQSEWYEWTGGTLYVKSFNEDRATAAAALVQSPVPAPTGTVASGENDGSTAITGEAATWGDEMEGQRKEGNNVINMLTFIKSETTKEMNFAIKTEQSSQSSFETVMNSLQTNINTETTNLATYETNLATALQNLEEAEEDKKNTEAERAAIQKYLADIEPRCTFIQTYFKLRTTRRKQETRALNRAITELKGTPAFQNAIAEEERVKLGKCADVCNGSFSTAHAECQACIEGVSVYGYCVQNSDAAGCDTALPTGSAASLTR